MEETRINFQNNIIENILDVLETSIIGTGLKAKYNYFLEKGNYSSTIVFILKEDKEMNATDFFLLGYLVGKDY